MRYVHEFVDDLVCERCPHYVEDEEGEFDLICLAQEDGSEFLFPDECPAYLGEWGPWRAVIGQIVPVCDEWGFLLAGQPKRIAVLSPASHEYLTAAGWSP